MSLFSELYPAENECLVQNLKILFFKIIFPKFRNI